MSFLEGFRSSTPPPRQLLILGLGGVGVCALLVVGYFMFLRQPYDVLYSNLRTADAATVVAALDKKKVPYRLDDGGARILVPRDVAASTRLSLAGQDLPINGTVGFELFNKSDLGLTEFSERINFQRALQGELSRTIMTMGPVDTARVHLTIAEPSVFRDDRRPSKASISVIPRPGMALTAPTIEGIQRLVAAAVPDLSPSDVVVIDDEGKILTGAPTPSDGQSAPRQEEQAIDDYYSARLRRALAGVLPERADVDVEARTQPSPTSIDGGAAALDAWSPTSRSFPLIVTIGLPVPPSPEAEKEVRRIAGQSAGLDSKRGDELIVTTSAGLRDDTSLSPGPAVPAGHAAGQRPVARPTPSPGPWVADLLFALTSALTVLGVALVWRRNGPRRLSERRRGELASRLQALLEEGEAHAAPPA